MAFVLWPLKNDVEVDSFPLVKLQQRIKVNIVQEPPALIINRSTNYLGNKHSANDEINAAAVDEQIITEALENNEKI